MYSVCSEMGSGGELLGRNPPPINIVVSSFSGNEHREAWIGCKLMICILLWVWTVYSFGCKLVSMICSRTIPQRHGCVSRIIGYEARGKSNADRQKGWCNSLISVCGS